MGAINYKNNNIINIGYKQYIYILDEDDEETEAFNACEDYKTASALFQYMNFSYYEVSVNPGYYDGFYIDIKRTCFYLDNYKERAEMLHEWNTIQNILLEIIENINCYVFTSCGLEGCGWLGYKESIRAIKKAGARERENIRKYPLESHFKTLDDKLKFINTCTL